MSSDILPTRIERVNPSPPRRRHERQAPGGQPCGWRRGSGCVVGYMPRPSGVSSRMKPHRDGEAHRGEPRRRGVAGADPRDPRRARVRRQLRLATGVAGVAAPRRAGRAQAGGAAHAHPRLAGRPSAAGLEGRVEPAEPGAPCSTGPGRTRLPGQRPEPAVGGRPHPNHDRRGRVVAGQRPGCARQPIVGWATDPRATTTLCSPRFALPRRPRREADLPQRQGRPVSTPRCGSPSGSSTPGSPRRPAAPTTATTRWPRTSGRRSRSSSGTGPEPPSLPAPTPSTP
jgi:hypothetical protein